MCCNSGIIAGGENLSAQPTGNWRRGGSNLYGWDEVIDARPSVCVVQQVTADRATSALLGAAPPRLISMEVAALCLSQVSLSLYIEPCPHPDPDCRVQGP